MANSLAAAKAAAVERFLVTAEPSGMVSALALSTRPRHNVTGVGIGTKIKKGKNTGEPCIRIYVEKKIDAKSIPAADMLPAKIKNVETDVIQTGILKALTGPPPAGFTGRNRLRPAQPGCSVGFQMSGGLMAGTFGAVVTDSSGKLYVLSNNHVLADENNLPAGSAIFQPGLLDGGKAPKDQIAKLTRFVKIQAGVLNKVDCAIAEATSSDKVSAVVLPKVGKLKSTAPIAAVVGMKVEKTGRTTGYTKGTVTDVSATMKITYDVGIVTFDEQIIVDGAAGSFSAAGDSGSLIVDQDSGQATGLLFAGSDTHTIANHIEEVLAALAISLA